MISTPTHDPTYNAIVPLHYSQAKNAAKVLSLAFSQDPLMQYFLPADKAAQLRILRQASAALIRYSQTYDQIYTTAGEIKGVAIWLPPTDSIFQFEQLSRLVTSGLVALPFQLPWNRLLSGLNLLVEEFSSSYISEPHWHLAMLGVHPDFQGQGVGAALLQPVLQEADRQGLACTLETSTQGAVRFYQRQGFEITHQREVTPGLPYWKMWRKPQPAL